MNPSEWRSGQRRLISGLSNKQDKHCTFKSLMVPFYKMGKPFLKNVCQRSFLKRGKKKKSKPPLWIAFLTFFSWSLDVPKVSRGLSQILLLLRRKSPLNCKQIYQLDPGSGDYVMGLLRAPQTENNHFGSPDRTWPLYNSVQVPYLGLSLISIVRIPPPSSLWQTDTGCLL